MTAPGLTLLGIETTCDETAAAIVRRDPAGPGIIVSSIVRSQLDEHAAFGGVVPEIAARAHVAALDGLIAKALAEAEIDFAALDGVAAAAGPGLIGGVIVGLTTAKAIALVHDKPLIAVNHLEAHALTPGLTDGLGPPYLLLLVSGGHTQLVHVAGVGAYRRLGTTVDDALGEAFDKVAKLLRLGFPGGPAVETMAAGGDPGRFAFPRPMKGRSEPNFSFSGLKTAVRQAADNCAPLTGRDIADICAGFQQAVVETVTDRVEAAFVRASADGLAVPGLVVSGGVAANARLREALQATAHRLGVPLVAPPLELCTDNAAMIAWAGAERLSRGLTDSLDTPPRARWPLDPGAVPAPGAGVKA